MPKREKTADSIASRMQDRRSDVRSRFVDKGDSSRIAAGTPCPCPPLRSGLGCASRENRLLRFSLNLLTAFAVACFSKYLPASPLLFPTSSSQDGVRRRRASRVQGGTIGKGKRSGDSSRIAAGTPCPCPPLRCGLGCASRENRLLRFSSNLLTCAPLRWQASAGYLPKWPFSSSYFRRRGARDGDRRRRPSRVQEGRSEIRRGKWRLQQDSNLRPSA
jgi:hypothetical protein